MKHTHVQMQFSLNDTTRTRAEVRTWNGKWTGDASVDPIDVGDQCESSDAARLILVKKLRELADVIERDG